MPLLVLLLLLLDDIYTYICIYIYIYYFWVEDFYSSISCTCTLNTKEANHTNNKLIRKADIYKHMLINRYLKIHVKYLLVHGIMEVYKRSARGVGDYRASRFHSRAHTCHHIDFPPPGNSPLLCLGVANHCKLWSWRLCGCFHVA